MRYFGLDQMFGAPMTNFRFTSWQGTEKDSKSLHLIGRTHVLYFCFISSNTTNKISKSQNLIICRSIFQLLVVWCSTRDQMDSGHKVPSPMRTVLSESVILLFKRINFIFTLLFWIKSLFFWVSQLSSSEAHSAWMLMQQHLHCRTAGAIWYYWSSAKSINLSRVIVSVILPSRWGWPRLLLSSLVLTKDKQVSTLMIHAEVKYASNSFKLIHNKSLLLFQCEWQRSADLLSSPTQTKKDWGENIRPLVWNSPPSLIHGFADCLESRAKVFFSLLLTLWDSRRPVKTAWQAKQSGLHELRTVDSVT